MRNASYDHQHDDDCCLCCEDDISFEQTWFSQRRLCIAEIRDTEFVLNLGQECDQWE